MTLPRPDSPPIPVALRALAAATDRLLATVDAMSAADFAGPSLLPGWSRAHVLAHLALNSKGVAGALTKLDQPDRLPFYASEKRRDADIARLAAQSPAQIADRVAVGAAVLAQHLGGGPTPEDALEAVGDAGAISRVLPDSATSRGGPADTTAHSTPFATAVADHAAELAVWGPDGTLERTPGGRIVNASDIPYMRWREVEIHHADLGLTYRPGDWSTEFAAFLYATAAFDHDGAVSMTLAATDGPRYELGPADAPHDRREAPPAPADGPPAPTSDTGPTISGSMADLAYWLIGRGDGEQLTSTGSLPPLGPWRRRA